MKRYRTVIVRTFLLFILPVFQLHALDVPNLPDATQPISGSLIVPPDATIRIVSHRGEWTAFFSTGGGGEPFFLIAGQLENTSGKPLTYLKFQFELLSKDGIVLHRDYGYNRKAEALREEDYETGKKSLAEMNIDPVAAGTQDGLRFFFFKDETPEFHSYRIRLLESR
jgi:hypothetical protein